MTPANLNQSKPTLNWLFTAYFDDETTIYQDPEDLSQTRTDGTGSRFTDVIAKKGLTSFWLSNGKESVGVDLVNGNFMVNETVVQLHNQFFEPEKYDLELVYFRETRMDNDVKATVQQDGSVSQETMARRHYISRYFIGWQTKVHGKIKQVTLAVS